MVSLPFSARWRSSHNTVLVNLLSPLLAVLFFFVAGLLLHH
jgi:hypothetical protein